MTAAIPAARFGGRSLRTEQTQSRYQKALLMIESNVIQRRMNPIYHIRMASPLEEWKDQIAMALTIRRYINYKRIMKSSRC